MLRLAAALLLTPLLHNSVLRAQAPSTVCSTVIAARADSMYWGLYSNMEGGSFNPTAPQLLDSLRTIIRVGP